MKSSAVLASLLFGSFAVAAPVDKRALVYKTELVTETVVIYTTVYDDNAVPEATATPAGYFYEQPKPSSAPAQPTPQPAPEQKPSSAPAPAPQPQAPSPAPAPSPSPAPVEQPKPVEQPAPSAPAPAPASAAPASAASSAAPAPAPQQNQQSGGSPTGQEYTGELTIYDINPGDKGACGTTLSENDMIVALAKPTWGESTYDVMTGASSNPWCGQKIQAEWNGNKVIATIMDLCPGCKGADIDLSLAAYKALTGKDEKTRIPGVKWRKVN